jgi:isopenicillin N synthase-like dioxygenase
LVHDGFVIVESPSSVTQFVEASFREASSYFRLSPTEKLRDRLPYDSGYRPLRGEYSSSPEHPDEVESFTVSHRIGVPIDAELSGPGRRLHKTMLGLFDAIEPLVEAITIVVAERFGVQDAAKLRGGLHLSSILQLNFSRPAETAAEFINDLHEDGCLLTVTSVTAPGLEIQTREGSFVPMLPSPGHLLVMSSEILYLLTGGTVRPVYHRVRPATAFTERMSVLFFADLHPTLCAPWVSNETNAAIDIGERVLKNSTRFGLSEWDLESLT